MEADTARVMTLDEGHPQASLGGTQCSDIAARATADDGEVMGGGAHGWTVRATMLGVGVKKVHSFQALRSAGGVVQGFRLAWTPAAVMSDKEQKSASPGKGLKIYFLPNLFTAANLFCGFLALTKVVAVSPEADLQQAFANAKMAIWLVLLACIFDALDGRVARIGGYESPFGREFDSLADIVSFGVVPAFLVDRIVMKEVFVKNPEVGWFIASVFVICGALRLARYNCLAAMEDEEEKSNEFRGFPIPMAAGLVASITYFLIWMEQNGYFEKGAWHYGRWSLPVVLLFLSAMMVSNVRYPTFKKVDWRAPRSFAFLVMAVLGVGLLFTLGRKLLPLALPLVFIAYLVYGFVRPWISRRTRRGIEVELLEAEE